MLFCKQRYYPTALIMRAATCVRQCSRPCARHRCFVVRAGALNTSSTSNLRSATSQDVPAIRQRLLQEKMNPLSLNPKNFTVVESEEGQLLAFAQLQPVAAAGASMPAYEFRSLVVDPPSRGQGLGSQLMQHIVSACPHDIYLTTLSKTTPFYQKAGFKLLQPADIPKWLWFEVAAGTVVARLAVNDQLVVMHRPRQQQ